MTLKIIFTATNGTQGSEPWITDGTPYGTISLGDLLAGTGASNASGFFDLGNGHMLFGASNGSQGRELWITDGTTAGTSLLRDIRTMPANLAGTTPGASYPNGFFQLAPGRAIFAANDGSNGSELWVTDGTAAGTSLLRDINPGTFVSAGLTLGNSSAPSAFVAAPGGRTLFNATNASLGNELWVTDGTAAGTSLLLDINPGTASASAQNFFRLASGSLLFSASSGTLGRELWITDGTAAGTSLVKEIAPGAADGVNGNTFGPAVSLGGGKVLFASAGNVEPWVTDGTAAGTYQLQDIRPGSASGLNAYGVSFFAAGGGKALFSANNGATGNELWVTDGTSAGTSLLRDLNPGTVASTPQGFTAVPGGKVVFSAIGPGTVGRELWVTDLTSGGTSLLLDIFPGTFVRYGYTYTNSSGPTFAGRLGDGRALFTATTEAAGRELWVTDGTAIGTSMVKDINKLTTSNTTGTQIAVPNSSNPGNFLALPDGRFAFTANDGLTGTELWITDGTTAGTMRAADINKINAGSNTQPSTQTRIFFDIGGGKFAFVAFDGITGNELWVTDTTATGTSLLMDVNPGNNNGGPSGLLALGDGRALFGANGGGVIARELFITDGTAAGTSLLKDINPIPGRSGSPGFGVVLAPNKILLTGDNGSTGAELWITDGTTAGTSLLVDINPGGASSSSNPRYFAAFGGGALFAATTATEGANELWFTDGTAAGTSLVKDIRPGATGSVVAKLTTLGSRAIFTANDGVSGNELWGTDGTAAGTSLLKDIRAGSANSYPGAFTLLGNGSALFFANDGVVGNELWITDGTSAGTSLLKDVNTGPSGGGYGAVIAPIGGGKAMFAGTSPGFGGELWVTDGTTAGTSMVVDLVPGAAGSYATSITGLGNGRVVFVASTPATGSELWVTDGSAAGTSLLRDFLPGTASSYPGSFRATGDGRALFEATDPAKGKEVWITDGTVAGTSMVADINTLTAASNPGSLTLFRTNDPPVLSAPIADQATDEDAPFAFAVPAGTFTDPNPWDSSLTYGATLAGGGALPGWLSYNPATNSFTGTPANGDVGTVSIRVVATDSFGRTASDVFDLTVANTNDAPVAAAFASAVVEDATGPNLWASLLALAGDDDLIYGDSLTIAGVDKSSTLGTVLFDAGTQTLRYVADASAFNALATGATMTDTFSYTVRDLAGATGTAIVIVTVTGIADSTVSFGVCAVSDAGLGGSIDGNEGANNPIQNQIVASEIISDTRPQFQQLLAFVDNGPGGSLGGVAGADAAYNLSDIGHGSKQTSLAQANTAIDPLLITAHGLINNKSLGTLTDGIRFINGSFGVNNGPEGESMGQWLNRGDSVTFAITGYDGGVNNLMRSASFTFDAQNATGDLLIDWDGAVTEDLNGPAVHEGFSTESEALRFNAVADNAKVLIDFYARTISIDDVSQAGVQGWFAAREADDGQQALTLGASVNGGAWAIKDLKIDTVAGVPVPGGGFVNSLF